MSDRSGAVPLSRPQNEMLAQVEAVLRRHPRLAAALQAGWTVELGCDDDAIWAALSRPGEADAVRARLATPRWWLPPRSGRALAIAEGLATDLEQGIQALP